MIIYTASLINSSRVKRNGADAVPIDFDPADHPIIARHVFGVSPFPPIGEVAARVAADLKRQHQVARLYSLCPRPVLAALIEVAASGELDTVLADYAQLDLEVVVALGGNHFPPVPIHGVERVWATTLPEAVFEAL